MVVIPLAAMIVPIVLILLAVLADLIFLVWAAYRMWHDEWAVRVGEYARGHLVRPLRKLAHAHHRIG
jgi:hypothetical protein